MADLKRPARRLTYEDAVDIQGRLLSGEYQFRIAADYDVNQGRIADVKKDRLHPGSYEEALRRQRDGR